MTDRPNYGPVRRLSPSVSADNRKPYSRTGLKGVLGTLDLNSGDTAVPTTLDSPYYPFHVEIPQLEAPSQNRARASAVAPAPPPGDGPSLSRDVAGFPTYEQYLRIEDEYLSSLSERKQPKALISQALFDKIFAVLQNGNDDRGASTAQFRFWVRKMFVLAYPQTSFSPTTRTRSPHTGSHGAGQHQNRPPQPPEPVVLHDKRPVAIREQLYEVLCYCHAVARHGGRDKTCATLRLHYSWVPKELTAKFVKSCPTCTLKRSGNPDLLSQFGPTVQPLYAPPLSLHSEAMGVTATAAAASFPVFQGGPNDTPPPPPGLSFMVGSPAGCNDGDGSGGFCSSIFATPDLSSVYLSPTLSAGSLGPTTPSPYLPSGLFGYPAVFDPGHGSLSLSSVSVAGGWDPSPLSPSVQMQMYGEELRAKHHHHQHPYPQQLVHQQQQHQHQQQERPMGADEVIDMRTRDVQLHLPVPSVHHLHPIHVRSAPSGSGLFQFSGVMNTPYPTIDGNDIDPALLMEGNYPHDPAQALVQPDAHADADTDADANMDMDMDGVGTDMGGRGGRRPYLLNLATTTLETPTIASASASLRGSSRYSVPQQNQQQLRPEFGLALSTVPAPIMASDSGITGGWRQQQQLLPPLPEAAAADAAVDSDDACLSGSHNISDRHLGPGPELALPLPPLSPQPASAPSTRSRRAHFIPASRAPATALRMDVTRSILGGGRDNDYPDALDLDDRRDGAAGYAEEDGECGTELAVAIEGEEEGATEFLERGADVQVQVGSDVVIEEASSSRVSRVSSESRSRWESPEAWLVQSDSFGEAHDDTAAVTM